MCIYVWAGACYSTHMEVRDQRSMGIICLLVGCGNMQIVGLSCEQLHLMSPFASPKEILIP